MVAQSPKLIGIVGGSCAGKTWLAERLEGLFAPRAARLSLDNFYRDRTHLSAGRRGLVNYDHPKAIDWAKAEMALETLATGESAFVPIYDFKTHGRMNRENILEARPIVIVEGLWLFHKPRARNFFDLKVFIRSSAEWREQKRIERDAAERGREARQVMAQLERFTNPMFERFVAPQEKWADVVVDSPIAERQLSALGEKIKSELLSSFAGI
jgi:uridine kinase